MKKIGFLTFAFGVMLIVAASCAKEEKEKEPVTRKIEFKKLSGASLSEGSKIGFFVQSPSYENVVLTVGSDGQLTSSTDLYWNVDQTEKSQVAAYAPFKEGVSSSSEQVFTVQADQSTAAALEASDFIYASCVADPAEASVSLSFDHVMSQACIYFDNRTGDEISSVEFGAISKSQNYSIWIGPGAVSGTGTVKAYAASGYYKAYFPAQTTSMTLKVTMQGGDVFEFELESNEYAAGKVYRNSESPIELSKSAPKQIRANFSVSDWVDGGQLNIKGEDPTPGGEETATLTYSEAKGTYEYGDPFTYANSFGTWEICCWSDGTSGTGFQLDSSSVSKNRLSYIGTPSFSKQIDTLIVTAASTYTGKIYVCNAGEESSSSILKTVNCSGVVTTIAVSDLKLSKLYIRSSDQLNVSKLKVIISETKPATESPFLKVTVPGFYTNTSTSPQSSLLIEEQEQFSYGKSSDCRTLAVTDFSTGMYKTLKIESSSLAVDTDYSAVLDENGETTEYEQLRCVKKTSSQVWLEDKSAGVGFVIPIS